jgi:hypothetical protein
LWRTAGIQFVVVFIVGRVLTNAAANVRFQSEVDMIRQAKPAGSVENDSEQTRAGAG